MRSRPLALVALLSIASQAQAHWWGCQPVTATDETSIAVYANLQGTECSGRTENGVLWGSIWVNLHDAALGGITGAEFAVRWQSLGADTQAGNLSFGFIPDRGATIVFGDPYAGGTNIAYSACQSRQRIHLCDFVLVENVPTTGIRLWVDRHETPRNQYFCCPLVTLCDGPAFTMVCVNRGGGDHDYWTATYWTVVNWPEGEAGGDGRCPAQSLVRIPPEPGISISGAKGANPASWTRLKSLYR